ncbi:MAG: hypothetical protein R3C10_24215 [Pirellulales bacterium]|nr:hypothetical protein [Planctomycetales bacterium]
MQTVERLDQLVRLARRLGYTVRQEWLGGNGGGVCELRGKKHLFLDLANSASEQLDTVVEVLAADERLATLTLSDDLRGLFERPKAA